MEVKVPVTPGKDTTEYEQTKSAKLWAVLGVILGLICEVGGATLITLQESGNTGTVIIIIGAVLQVLAVAQKMLVDLGYINSRTQVKVAAEKAIVVGIGPDITADQ